MHGKGTLPRPHQSPKSGLGCVAPLPSSQQNVRPPDTSSTSQNRPTSVDNCLLRGPWQATYFLFQGLSFSICNKHPISEPLCAPAIWAYRVAYRAEGQSRETNQQS